MVSVSGGFCEMHIQNVKVIVIFADIYHPVLMYSDSFKMISQIGAKKVDPKYHIS